MRRGKLTHRKPVLRRRVSVLVVAKGNDAIYVSSLRDLEVIEVKLGAQPAVVERIRLRAIRTK